MKASIKMKTTDTEKKKTKIDILGNLPIEISYKILMHLTADDIDNLRNCSKTWRHHVNYSFFWKSQFLKNYFHCGNEEPKTENYQKFVQKFSCNWKSRYMYYRALEFNYINNNFKYVPVKCSSTIFRCIYFDDSILIIVACINDSEDVLQVINSSTGLVEKTFTHTSQIIASLKYNDLLMSLSTNEMHLLVWNIEREQLVFDVHVVFFGNDHPYSLVACKHLIFILTSNDHVYALNTETDYLVLLSQVDIVCSYNDVIALGKTNMTIEIKDSNLCLLHTINRVMRRTTVEMMMRDDYVIEMCTNLGEDDNTDGENCSSDIWVWNIKTNGHFRIVHAHVSSITVTNEGRLHLTPKTKLFYRLGGQFVGLWDVPTNSCSILCDTKDYIMDLTVNELFIFTTKLEENSDLKIWCARSGKFVRNLGILKPHAFDMPLKATNTKLLYSTDYIFDKMHIMNFEPTIK